MIEYAKEGATLRDSEAAPCIKERLKDLNVRRTMAMSKVTSGMYGLALMLHAFGFHGESICRSCTVLKQSRNG